MRRTGAAASDVSAGDADAAAAAASAPCRLLSSLPCCRICSTFRRMSFASLMLIACKHANPSLQVQLCQARQAADDRSTAQKQRKGHTWEGSEELGPACCWVLWSRLGLEPLSCMSSCRHTASCEVSLNPRCRESSKRVLLCAPLSTAGLPA